MLRTLLRETLAVSRSNSCCSRSIYHVGKQAVGTGNGKRLMGDTSVRVARAGDGLTTTSKQQGPHYIRRASSSSSFSSSSSKPTPAAAASGLQKAAQLIPGIALR